METQVILRKTTNGRNQSCFVMCPVIHNELLDTIEVNILTKQVFCKVIAVDINYDLSAYCEPIEIRHPDIVPPAKKVFTKAHKVKAEIELEWQPIFSEDVAKYLLLRIYKKDGSSKDLLNWNPVQKQVNPALLDSLAVMGEYVFYTLSATDGAGNAIIVVAGK